MATVWLGNPAAVEVRKCLDEHFLQVFNEDGTEKRERVSVPEGTWTQVGPIPEGQSLPELVLNLTHPQGIWAHHSDAPAPSWIASDDPALASALGLILGCPVQPIPTAEGTPQPC